MIRREEASDEFLLMGLRDGESEPVLVGVDEGCAVFILDDGSRLELDLTETKSALAEHHTIRCECCGRIGMDEEPACDHFTAWWMTARGWGEWRPWRQG